ncbi:MAG TPA: polyprenol monophosphomannose synthase [Acidimicrobiales bacterium]|nr:polyprenol monophosphomannose synthase [Acidimicrobiales bacterium]
MADAWTLDERIGAPRVLIVLPTYNELENITGILDRIRDAVPTADMLVVDDGSPDGTADRVRWIAKRMPGLHLLERTSKDGLGAAYRAGFSWGMEQHYDVLVEMDADGSHRPEDLPSLLAGVDAGADLVIGSRYVAGGVIPNWKLSRRLLSRGGNAYASTMLGLGLHDSTAGFRAYRAGLLERMGFAQLCADGYGFQIEGAWRALRCGAQVTEVPITFEDRLAGESKMSKAIVVEALRLVTRWGLGERAARARARFAHPLQPNWAHARLAGSKRSY